MSRSSKTFTRVISAVIALGFLAAGCSDIYYDRREGVTFASGDAVAANRAVQTTDPWPAASADRNIQVNGDVVAAGIERYRTGKVIPPRGNSTSSAGFTNQAAQQAAGSSSAAPTSPPK
jgi:hypothetical protein